MEDIQKLYGKLIQNIIMMIQLFYSILIIKEYLTLKSQMNLFIAKTMIAYVLGIIIIRIIILGINL